MQKVINSLNDLAIKHRVREGAKQIAIVNPSEAQLICIKDICRTNAVTVHLNKFLTLIDF